MLLKEIIYRLNELVPQELQEPWDNSGLVLGDINDEITGAVISLDSEIETVKFAIKEGYNLIINHHPLIFKGLKSLDFRFREAKILREAVKNDINIFSMHTNLDAAKDGVNDALANKLAFNLDKPLIKNPMDKRIGIGRFGEIDEAEIKDLAKTVKMKLEADFIVLGGCVEKVVRRLAVVGGSGADFLMDCYEKQIDAIITSDFKYHDFQLAKSLGLAVIDAGHYETEAPVLDRIAEIFDEMKIKNKILYNYHARDII